LRVPCGLAAALLATLMLCWPALLNGGGFFFPDSSNYLRQADAAVGELTGWRSEWSDKHQFYAALPRAEAPRSPQQAAPAPPPAAGPLHPPLLGRSIYYGLTIFPFMVLFGSLGVVALQSALAVATIWLTLAAFAVPRPRMAAWLLGSAAVLAALTSLPFFVSMLMPDVFAGFAVVLAVSACVGWGRLAVAERAGLVALLVLCGMAHSSHVLLLMALACIALAVSWLMRLNLKAGLAAMLLAAVAGLVGEQAFIFATTQKMGQPPIRPPFLTARLIDDGPGWRCWAGAARRSVWRRATFGIACRATATPSCGARCRPTACSRSRAMPSSATWRSRTSLSPSRPFATIPWGCWRRVWARRQRSCP